MIRSLLPLMAFSALLTGSEATPKFEDYPVSTQWNGPNAVLKLVRADERKFRTQLTRGARERANFAGHYRFVGWGCGSVCAAGALIDLQTGNIYPPPGQGDETGWDRWIFAGGFVDGPYIDLQPDSRLVVVRQQAKDPASQNVSYYEWSGTAFRLVAMRVEKKARNASGSGPKEE